MSPAHGKQRGQQLPTGKGPGLGQGDGSGTGRCISEDRRPCSTNTHLGAETGTVVTCDPTALVQKEEHSAVHTSSCCVVHLEFT